MSSLMYEIGQHNASGLAEMEIKKHCRQKTPMSLDVVAGEPA
jgi:hypothetical protein